MSKNTKYDGRSIRLLRIQFNLSREELASKMHVSLSTLCRLEQNKRNPSLDELNELSEIFNVPITYFFETNSSILKH